MTYEEKRPYEAVFRLIDVLGLFGILSGISARRAFLNMKSFFSYLKNVRGELAHVVWPTPKQAAMHTLLILLISALVAVFIGVLDYLLTSLVGYIISQ